MAFFKSGYFVFDCFNYNMTFITELFIIFDGAGGIIALEEFDRVGRGELKCEVSTHHYVLICTSQ